MTADLPPRHRPIENPPELDLDTLVPDLNSLSGADLTLVGDVIEQLDAIDHYVETGNDLSAAGRAAGVAATVRAVLAAHRPDPDNQCMDCPTASWPCPLWRTAHRWMIELEPSTGHPYEWDYVVAYPNTMDPSTTNRL